MSGTSTTSASASVTAASVASSVVRPRVVDWATLKATYQDSLVFERYDQDNSNRSALLPKTAALSSRDTEMGFPSSK